MYNSEQPVCTYRQKNPEVLFSRPELKKKGGGATYIHTQNLNSQEFPFRIRSISFSGKFTFNTDMLERRTRKNHPPFLPFFVFFLFIYMYGTVRYVRSFNYSPNKNKKKTPRNHLPTLPTYLDHFNQSSPFPPPPSPPNKHIHTYLHTYSSIQPSNRPTDQIPLRTSLH